MLKSFLIGFFIVLLSLLIAGCTYYRLESEEEIINEQIQVEDFPLKSSETCNNVEAIADIMFGEGENQSIQAKHNLAYFLISESIKGDRTLCEELRYRMPGGALKYSSMFDNLRNLKNRRPSSYQNNINIAQEFWKSKKYLNYRSMYRYNHFITIHLARNNPPEWFKYYITDYKFSGDHVFVNLNFENKKEKRYIGNYWKMISDLK